MNEIKVDKQQLLDTLRTNRSQHRDIFLEAQEGYRTFIVSELEKMLQEARDGKQIRRAINVVEPVDQTKDYDRAIKMLEMSQEDLVTISENDFSCYVLDDWSWMRNFLISNSTYSKTAARNLQGEIF